MLKYDWVVNVCRVIKWLKFYCTTWNKCSCLEVNDSGRFYKCAWVIKQVYVNIVIFKWTALFSSGVSANFKLFRPQN